MTATTVLGQPLQQPSSLKVVGGRAKSEPRDHVVSAPTLDTGGQALAGHGRPPTLQPLACQWPMGTAMTPNGLLRSALFGCHVKRARSEPARELQPGEKRVVGLAIEQRIPAPKPYNIIYRGEMLNQFDSLIWQLCVLSCRQADVDMGQPVLISLAKWADILGMVKHSTLNNRAILESLSRLMGGHLRISNDGSDARRMIQQPMLERIMSTETKGQAVRYYITMSPMMLTLFDQDATEIDLARKASLKSALAKWLHDFYSTHSHPIPMAVTTLRTWSGMDNTLSSRFRKMLSEAIDELKTCQPPLFAANSQILNDQLVVKKASNSRLLPRANRSAPVLDNPAFLDPMLGMDAWKDPSHDGDVQDTRTRAQKDAAKQRARVAL